MGGSIRVSKFTSGRDCIASDQPPSRYLELVGVADNDSNGATTSFWLFDSNKDLSLAGSNYFCFATKSIEAVAWSPSNHLIHLRSCNRNTLEDKG